MSIAIRLIFLPFSSRFCENLFVRNFLSPRLLARWGKSVSVHTSNSKCAAHICADMCNYNLHMLLVTQSYGSGTCPEYFPSHVYRSPGKAGDWGSSLSSKVERFECSVLCRSREPQP